MERTELRAIKEFEELCKSRGWEFKKGNKGDHCDFFVNGKKVEVKGSTRNNIPDTYNTEFDEKLKFKPDWLFVVYLPDNGKSVISAISKEEINRYEHKEKMMVTWNHTLKTNMAHGHYQKIPKEL